MVDDELFLAKCDAKDWELEFRILKSLFIRLFSLVKDSEIQIHRKEDRELWNKCDKLFNILKEMK